MPIVTENIFDKIKFSFIWRTLIKLRNIPNSTNGIYDKNNIILNEENI